MADEPGGVLDVGYKKNERWTIGAKPFWKGVHLRIFFYQGVSIFGNGAQLWGLLPFKTSEYLSS